MTIADATPTWDQAARALLRLQSQGGSLGNRDRRALRAVDTDLAADPLAATLPEVVKPRADRARALLAVLLHAEPELEKVVIHPAQLAWLVEFLTTCAPDACAARPAFGS